MQFICKSRKKPCILCNNCNYSQFWSFCYSVCFVLLAVYSLNSLAFPFFILIEPTNISYDTHFRGILFNWWLSQCFEFAMKMTYLSMHEACCFSTICCTSSHQRIHRKKIKLILQHSCICSIAWQHTKYYSKRKHHPINSSTVQETVLQNEKRFEYVSFLF